MVDMVFDPVNLGAFELRKDILDFLSDRVPQYIELIRTQHPEFDDNRLPSPVQFDAYDPLTAKDYPSIGAYINGSEDYTLDEDISFTGGQTFTSVYEVTIFVANRTAFLGTDDEGVQVWETPERDSAMRQRDIYLGAVKSVLFNEPSIGTSIKDIGRSKIQRDTYEDMCPEPMVAGSHYIATGVISLKIERRETTAPPVLGYLHNVDTVVTVIDDDPGIVDPFEIPGDT